MSVYVNTRGKALYILRFFGSTSGEIGQGIVGRRGIQLPESGSGEAILVHLRSLITLLH